MKRPEFFDIAEIRHLGIDETISFFEEKGFCIPKDNYKKSVFFSNKYKIDILDIYCQQFYLLGESFSVIYDWYGEISATCFYVTLPLAEHNLKEQKKKFHNLYGPAISYPLIDHYYIDGEPIDHGDFKKQMIQRRVLKIK
jgi:hypothetical protein